MVEYPRLDLVFRALGDGTRRGMLKQLAARERTVGELAAPYRMSLASASKHVKALERAGLVKRTIRGRTHLLPAQSAAARESRRVAARVRAPLGHSPGESAGAASPSRQRRKQSLIPTTALDTIHLTTPRTPMTATSVHRPHRKADRARCTALARLARASPTIANSIHGSASPSTQPIHGGREVAAATSPSRATNTW